jgi:regulatory protein
VKPLYLPGAVVQLFRGSKNLYLSMAFKKYLTKEQALQKAKYYCGYQERCHSEVKEKLYSLGLYKQQVEECISQLIEENYLNEERFAQQFAGGKFRMKQWGRVKIKYELKQKQVSEYCIKKGLKEIDEEDYLKVLKKLTLEKWTTVKAEKNVFIKLRKTQDYLMQKGYEQDLIRQALQTLQKPESAA